MKNCPTCKTDKPLTDYTKDKSSKDGHYYQCRSCKNIRKMKRKMMDIEGHREAQRRSYQNLKAKRVIATKAFFSTPEGKALKSKINKKWNENNKEKRRAHSEVSRQIKWGQIKPNPCEVCGEVKTHAHHDDYSKPLEVRWLCGQHHREWHRHDRDAKRQHAQAQQ